MRCLVTGASGHLGSYLTRRLVTAGARTFVLVRRESDLWRLADVLDHVEVLRADLSEVRSVAHLITQARPEAVFHLAWQGVTSAFKNTQEQLTTNVAGSLDLFETVRDAGCKLWVGVGSQAEYGPHDGVLDEDTPVRPVTAYGTGKLAVGVLTKKLCELARMRYVWLRLLATYGPQDDERHLIPATIKQLLARARPSLTSGEQRLDYLYVEDAAEAIYEAALHSEAQGVYNLGSGEARSVRDILERIRDLIDPSLPLGFGEMPYPPDHSMRLETSLERLRATIGWTPRFTLDEGLRRTIQWYRSQEKERVS
jgi:UDP-glucose 4-epimerase